MIISSLQNPSVKNLVKLTKARERKAQNLFVVEGARELSLALAGDYSIEQVYVCRALFEDTRYPDFLDSIHDDKIIDITAQVFEKVSYRKSSDGLIALVKPKSHTLADVKLLDNPFVIILESVEKPGNLGAILRTADAAAVDAVIVCDPQTDIYNPNVVRSSVGALFTVQTAICTTQQAMDWLNEHSIASYAAELEAAKWYQDVDYCGPSAIVMGTEADGLTSAWLNYATKRVKIPMCGKIDSLNVSVSTAVLTFEAMRQRRGRS